MRRTTCMHISRIVAVALSALLLAACADGDSPDEGTAGPRVEDGVFYGTTVEYSRLKQQCFTRLGVDVEPDPQDPTVFGVDIQDIETILELEKQCEEEIGRWEPMLSVSDEYLERGYEHALWQRQCLIDLGYDLPEPPTLEHFLEHRDFDPIGQTGALGPEWVRLAEQCPKLHVWEQQQGLLD